jgi:Arc/MetJ family transcription regulator
VSDDELLARAERALTQIKVEQGLSEAHEAVLAALRIRLTGSQGASLEDLLAAADDPSPNLDDVLAAGDTSPPKPTLDDLFGPPSDEPGD